MSWVEFNNINSDEIFGDKLLITKRVIGTPQPKSYTVEIPFSSKIIDYSFINGPIFDNRPIDISINLEGYDRDSLYKIYQRVLRWLLAGGYSKLKLSGVDGYYMAKLGSISQLEEVVILGNLDISFMCHPWLYEEDVEYSVTIMKNKSIFLEGSFMPCTPEITASNVCTIQFEGKEYVLSKGKNIDYDIVFKEGTNEIKLISETTIEFVICYKKGGL